MRRPESPRPNSREIGSAPALQHHGMPWALALRIPALWRIAAIGACYVYALGFFQSWLQTYLVKGRGFTRSRARAVVAHLRRRGNGERVGWHGGRLDGQTPWPAQRPPLARRRGTQRGGAVPDGGHLRAKRQPGARVPVVARTAESCFSNRPSVRCASMSDARTPARSLAS